MLLIYEVHMIKLLTRLFMADYKSLANIPLDQENRGLFYAPQVKCILKLKGRSARGKNHGVLHLF